MTSNEQFKESPPVKTKKFKPKRSIFSRLINFVFLLVLFTLLFYLLFDSIDSVRLWIPIIAGVFFLISVFTGSRSSILPAVVLLSVGTFLLLIKKGWLEFELWRVWIVLLVSIGFGLLLSFNRKMFGTLIALPIGGLFLIAGGGGLGFESWYDYQVWLRNLLDNYAWMFLVFLFFTAILFLYYFRTKDKFNQQSNLDIADKTEVKIENNTDN